MRPAALGVAAREHVVGRVEENHFGMNSGGIELREYPGPLRKEQPLARIDSERDALQRGIASGREHRDILRQRDRKIVNAVEAEVLEHAHRRRASRT